MNDSSATMMERRELHRSLSRILIPPRHVHRNDQWIIETGYIAANIQAFRLLPELLE